MKRLLGLAFTVSLLLAAPRSALAVPFFAHQYDLTCQKCHEVIPRLNPFGQAFSDRGYRLPGTTPQPAFPLSAKVNLAYSSEPDPTGLPKAIVDEVEVFVAGKTSPRTNYFVEQYIVDGGRPGATREAWFANRFTPEDAKIPVYVRAGIFGLPLPVDPETFRETAQHYAVFDQIVGNNPFNFFDPKIGAELRAGYADRGLSARLLALEGHDTQSGISTSGIDTMAYAQDALGPVTLSLYRYDGSRSDGLLSDRFWRQGFGVTYAGKRWATDTVLQTGHDTSFDAAGLSARSSGGFTDVRYALSTRVFALVRYEGTNDPTSGMTRDVVPLMGYRVSRNSRLTIEDAISHAGTSHHTLSAQYTVAY